MEHMFDRSHRPDKRKNSPAFLLAAIAILSAGPVLQAQVVIKEAFSQEFTIFNRPSSNGTDSVLENIKDAASREFTLSAPLPDVIVTGVIMQPPDALPGSDFTVAWRVTNLGPGRMPGSWKDTVYYSTDDIVGNDTVLGEVPHMGPDLLPGESADRQASFILPLVDGPYFIVVTPTSRAWSARATGSTTRRFRSIRSTCSRSSRPT